MERWALACLIAALHTTSDDTVRVSTMVMQALEPLGPREPSWKKRRGAKTDVDEHSIDGTSEQNHLDVLDMNAREVRMHV
jgi:hypothetical protein